MKATKSFFEVLKREGKYIGWFSRGKDVQYIYLPYWPSLRSRWLDIGQVLLRAFFDRDQVEVNKNAKKNEATIKPFWPKKLGQWRIYYISKKINFSQKRARWAHLKLPFRTQVPTRESSHIIKVNIVGLGVASDSFDCLSPESLLITQSCNFLYIYIFFMHLQIPIILTWISLIVW